MPERIEVFMKFSARPLTAAMQADRMRGGMNLLGCWRGARELTSDGERPTRVPPLARERASDRRGGGATHTDARGDKEHSRP